MAEQLMELWKTTLQRTQYAEAKAVIRTGKADGTILHFWAPAGAGMIHSPKHGSVLAGLADVVHELRTYTDSRTEYGALASKVASALRRVRKAEPCLEPAKEPP
jgi:hypothetical protein